MHVLGGLPGYERLQDVPRAPHSGLELDRQVVEAELANSSITAGVEQARTVFSGVSSGPPSCAAIAASMYSAKRSVAGTSGIGNTRQSSPV